MKRGARAGASLDPDPAAVARDDAVNGGQTDSGPLVFRATVQALEGLEQLRGVDRIEADAVVADEVNALFRAAQLDARLWLLAGELPGVAEEVLEGDGGQGGIDLRLEARGDLHRDGAAGVALAQVLDDACPQRAEIHALALQGGARDLGQREQVVDQQ